MNQGDSAHAFHGLRESQSGLAPPVATPRNPSGVEEADDAPFRNAPPYQSLPLPRADLPPGVILSRDMTAFIREEDIDWEVETVEDDDGNEVEVRHRAVALPLLQGVMVSTANPNVAAWRSGQGLNAVWDDPDPFSRAFEPHFLIQEHHAPLTCVDSRRLRYAFRDVARSTEQKTMIGSVIARFPCGNTLGVLNCARTDATALLGTIISWTYDWSVRARLGATHLNYFVVAETPLVAPAFMGQGLTRVAASLSWNVGTFATDWFRLSATASVADLASWRSLWALSPHERLRLRCILDAAVAALYGLDLDDLKWILKDCDHPVADVTNKAFARRLDPKGFWRVDKHEPPERRHTVLTLAAFADLQALIAAVTAAGGTRDDAIAAFCGQATNPSPGVNGLIGSIDASEGWMLPQNFRLADLGVGHDIRAEQPQPVAATLGPRFYDWQLSQDAAESWRECALHARNLLGADGFERLKAELEGRDIRASIEPSGIRAKAADASKPTAAKSQKTLFE